MSDTTEGAPAQDAPLQDGPDAAGAQAGAQASAQATGQGPRVAIHTQFLKDLSFENPNAPQTLQTAEQPETNVKVDIQAKKIEGEDNIYEVGLSVSAEAKRGDMTVFVAELVYAGIFSLHVAPDLVRPAVMIECPRLLFPFARQVLADAVRNGGFPPLLLQPIDFVEIYRQDVAQRQQSSAPADGTDGTMGGATA